MVRLRPRWYGVSVNSRTLNIDLNSVNISRSTVGHVFQIEECYNLHKENHSYGGPTAFEEPWEVGSPDQLKPVELENQFPMFTVNEMKLAVHTVLSILNKPRL